MMTNHAMISHHLQFSAALWIYMTAFYFIARIRNNNSLADVAWGMGFVLLAYLNLIMAPEITFRQVVMTVLVTVWGVRLSFHVYSRNRGKPEDFRYAEMRRKWEMIFIPISGACMMRLRIVPGILLCISTSIRAEIHSAAQTDSLINAGIRQTLLCDFDGAMASFQKVVETDPGNPAGPFYLAATLQSKMMDEETDALAAEFFKQTDRVIRMTKEDIKAGGRDPLAYEYLGSAYSYRGLFEAKQGRLVKGVLHAHKGVGYLEEALNLDSTLVDACAGVGNYKYWSGHFYKYLKWLPFIRDEREPGIRLIRKTVERGKRSRWVGVTSLGWIEFDRKNFKAGLELFESGLREFPGSRFFLWGAADCAFGMKDFRLAIRLYSELLSSIRDSGGRNGYNEAECLFKLMKAFDSLGEGNQAVLQAQAIVELKPSTVAVESRIKKHRKAARECLERYAGKNVGNTKTE